MTNVDPGRDPIEEEVDAEGRRLIDRVNEAYAPPERTAVQNAAFDASLRARLESTGSTESGFGARIWGPALAAAAIAGLVLVLRATESAPPEPEFVSAPVEPVEATAEPTFTTTEDALMALVFESDEGDDTSPDLSDALPDDYAAIDSLLLGG